MSLWTEFYGDDQAERDSSSASGEALLEPQAEPEMLAGASSFTVGAHLSIAGAIWESIGRAISLECDCLQIFSRNPRSWRAKALSDEDAAQFRRRRQSAGLDPVVVHVPYLINLCSSDPDLYERSVNEFVADLGRAARIGADYFVSHVGSHKGAGRAAGLHQIASALQTILADAPRTVSVLLENTSGSANSLGHSFEQLEDIIAAADRPGRLGLCLDTAHAYQAGYDVSSPGDLDRTLDELDRCVGLERLKIIHANDSKTRLGSHHDRHEHIGRGYIGLDGFRTIVNHPLLRNLPFILETPIDASGGTARDLRVLRSLRSTLPGENLR
jgi:deoxyribonuclease-4